MKNWIQRVILCPTGVLSTFSEEWSSPLFISLNAVCSYALRYFKKINTPIFKLWIVFINSGYLGPWFRIQIMKVERQSENLKMIDLSLWESRSNGQLILLLDSQRDQISQLWHHRICHHFCHRIFPCDNSCARFWLLSLAFKKQQWTHAESVAKHPQRLLVSSLHDL